MDIKSLFPCWGKFERMGHDATYGHFEALDGLIVVATIPGLNARDDEHPETEDEIRILQIGGPAYYGFTVLDEATVMAQIEARRPWNPPLRRALPGPVEDDELTHDPDSAPQEGAEEWPGESTTLQVLDEIRAERARQVAKGYDAAHDDMHADGEMADAAGLIAMGDPDMLVEGEGAAEEIAEHALTKHGCNHRRRCIIAAALLVAEIERVDRPVEADDEIPW